MCEPVSPLVCDADFILKPFTTTVNGGVDRAAVEKQENNTTAPAPWNTRKLRWKRLHSALCMKASAPLYFRESGLHGRRLESCIHADLSVHTLSFVWQSVLTEPG